MIYLEAGKQRGPQQHVLRNAECLGEASISRQTWAKLTDLYSGHTQPSNCCVFTSLTFMYSLSVRAQVTDERGCLLISRSSWRGKLWSMCIVAVIRGMCVQDGTGVLITHNPPLHISAYYMSDTPSHSHPNTFNIL